MFRAVVLDIFGNVRDVLCESTLEACKYVADKKAETTDRKVAVVSITSNNKVYIAN